MSKARLRRLLGARSAHVTRSWAAFPPRVVAALDESQRALSVMMTRELGGHGPAAVEVLQSPSAARMPRLYGVASGLREGRTDGVALRGDGETHVRRAFSHLPYLPLVASVFPGSQGKSNRTLRPELNARDLSNVTRERFVNVSCGRLILAVQWARSAIRITFSQGH